MDITIVGAGIAGLSAGIGLRRAGHKVTILEQSPLLQETGAAITITPNASRVLQAWDFNFEQSKMVSISKGSLLDGTTMDVLIPNYLHDIQESYGTPLYSAHRVDLHTQLRSLATQEEGPRSLVNVQTRAKVIDYDANAGKVTLADGRILQADFFVAADGVHSSAVQHVLGENEIRASNTGWSCMRWLVSSEKLLNEVQNFLYLSQAFDSSHATESFRAIVDPSLPVEYAMKDFGPTLQAVVKKAKDVRFWKLIAREPMPAWHKDRLVIIGDAAAHPMLTFQAQGGGQAIEDGAALGVLFDQLYDKEIIPMRLRLFEEIRKNRASAVQMISNSSPPAPQSVRDAAAKYLPDGKKLDSPDDINKYLWTFDVIGECKAILA